MKARRKTPLLDVWVYSSTATTVPMWAVGHIIVDGEDVYLIRRSGKQLLNRGEWLVRDLDGEPEWMTNKDFARLYELSP